MTPSFMMTKTLRLNEKLNDSPQIAQPGKWQSQDLHPGLAAFNACDLTTVSKCSVWCQQEVTTRNLILFQLKDVSGCYPRITGSRDKGGPGSYGFIQGTQATPVLDQILDYMRDSGPGGKEGDKSTDN